MKQMILSGKEPHVGAITLRYAVLMKVHYWDGFTERRLQHLLGKVATGDVHVFVDETRGPVGKIPYDRVMRATERDMEELEVLPFPPGQVFWYNVDYPLYYFFSKNRDYDYYLMCEYDAVLNVDIDDLVRTVARDRVDYVGFRFRLTERSTRWDWRETCDGVYPESTILHKYLNCITLHSRRSVEFLLERRRIVTRRYRRGEITNWPFCEAFIPTEMLNNGFVVRQLGDFGRVEKYDWWPPTRESDLASLQDQAFLHPVLDEQKYIVSCVRYGRLQSYFWRDGQLRRLLERNSLSAIIPALLREFKRRLMLRAFDGVWWRQVIGRVRAWN